MNPHLEYNDEGPESDNAFDERTVGEWLPCVAIHV